MKLLLWFRTLIQIRSGRARRSRQRPTFSGSTTCAAEGLEVRAPRSAPTIQAIDGTGNNLANPGWGSAGADLLRVSPVAYADGISAPSLPNSPGARVISDALNDQAMPSDRAEDVPTVDRNSLSD